VSEKDALLGLLAGWCAKAKEYRDAHENARIRLRRWHYLLGVPAIVLSAGVAMAVFATLQRAVPVEVSVGVGALSVGAAILAACQTFLRCSDRAEAHRHASSDYEGVADHAELTAALYGSGALEEGRLQELRDACADLQKQMAQLATQRPEVSERDRRPRALPQQPAVAVVRAEEAKVPAATSAPPVTTSSPPPATASIPPPRMPLGTLPPVRAPQPRSPSSIPPPVERWEKRPSSQAPPPLEEVASQKPR
jgi:hypothetical protein